MVGSIFWSVIPFAVVCLIWAHNGDSPVYAQNFILGLVGAVIGGSALIWGGYVARDLTAKAQTVPGTTQMAQDQSSKPSVNITGGNNVFSLGQMGGQTAQTIINYGAPPRVIPDAAKQILINGLTPPDKKQPKIVVSCAATDAKCCLFADQWELILRSSGWVVTTGPSVFGSPPMVGVVIAVRSADTLGAPQLQKAFSMLGENAVGALDPTIPEGEIHLRIGPI
jgi:hypothetical protein